MTIAVANKKKMYVGPETTWATTPSLLSDFYPLQYMSDTIEQQQAEIESRQITPTRDLRDTVRDQISAIGSINHEFLAGNTDVLIKAALRSAAKLGATANVVILASGTVSATVSNGTYTGTGFAAATIGSFISIKGFVNPTNNGIKKVLTASATVITTAGKVNAAEASAPAITITQLGYYQLGEVVSDFVSFSILMNYSNVITPNPMVHVYPGCYVDSMSMELSGGIMTGSFNFIGKNLVPAIVVPTGTAKAVFGTPVFNKVDNTSYLVNNVLANGIGFTWNLANNMRAQNQQMGSPYAVGVGDGGPVLGGTLSAYFENNTQLNDFANYTFRSMDFIAADDAGRGYAWEMPQVRILRAATPATGVDTDIVADFNWKAMRGNTAANLPSFKIHTTETIQP
jgi:hypothetical protein